MNSEQKILPDYVAYTKGVCRNTAKDRPGVSAYIMVKDKKIVAERARRFTNTNQHQMELMAMISAANFIPDGNVLLILSNNQYCIDVLTGKCDPGNYERQVELYLSLTADKVVYFEKIGINDGDYLNGRVRALADLGYSQT